MEVNEPRWLKCVDPVARMDWLHLGWLPVLVKLEPWLLGRYRSGNWRGPTLIARRYVMNCCFHEERTPSLSLYPSGIYLCHGCQAFGDILLFVVELLELDNENELKEFFEEVERNMRLLGAAEHPGQTSLLA